MHSVHSEDRQDLLPQVLWQELTDQTAKSPLYFSSALREVVTFASAVMHWLFSQPQSGFGEEEAMQVLNRSTSWNR